MKKNLNLRKLLILMPLLLAILMAILLRNPQEVNPGGNTGSSVEASTTASSEIAATIATSKTSVIAATEATSKEEVLPEDGEYTSKDDVALYIHTYGKLPGNFITKKEAQKLGWPGGSLESYAPGKSIGGDNFGNYEGLLPKKKGRKYYECDIDTKGKSKRGAKRIIFSNDGLVYYTKDHYESFELLYGDP